MLSATELTWIVATFVKILKLTFSRHIGLYCWILLASCVFGNNIMTPKFKLKSGRLPLCRSWNICMRSPLMTSQNCWLNSAGKLYGPGVLLWSISNIASRISFSVKGSATRNAEKCRESYMRGVHPEQHGDCSSSEGFREYSVSSATRGDCVRHGRLGLQWRWGDQVSILPYLFKT